MSIILVLGPRIFPEVLFMILIYEQQKMINELIARLAEQKTLNRICVPMCLITGAHGQGHQVVYPCV